MLKAILLGLILCTAAHAFADGEDLCQGDQCDADQPAPEASGETSIPKLDQRLPPVLPGEEVTVNGKRMRVWSTSGPVPVGNPPEPWREFNGRSYVDSNVDVIVDGRRRVLENENGAKAGESGNDAAGAASGGAQEGTKAGSAAASRPKAGKVK